MPDILHEGVIRINSLNYPLLEGTQVNLRSMGLLGQEPQGTLTYSKRPGVVTRILVDVRKGIGLYRLLPQAGDVPTQAWDGLFDGTTFGAITLPPLVTSAGRPSGVGASVPPWLHYEWDNKVWTSWGVDLYYWLGPSGTSWSASQRTLAGQPYSVVSHINGGTNRIFVLQGTDIDWQTAGGSWSRITTSVDAHWGVSYNAFLWTASKTGTFRRAPIGTEAIASWTARQSVPVGDGEVLGLFMYREPVGDPAIYAKTSEGLLTYNDTNDKWYPTELTYPRTTAATTAVDVWRGIQSGDGEMAGAHVPVGMGVYGYVARTGSPALVTALGLDLNDGVPSGYSGKIRSLVPSHNFNIALVDATTSSFDDAEDGYAEPPLGGPDVIPSYTGRTWVARYSGLGWFKTWQSAATDSVGRTALVSQAYGVYRAYWDANNTLYWMDLDTNVLNPREVTTTPRAAAGDTIWSWDLGSAEGQQDTLIEAITRVRSATATETITINYGTDFADSTWTAPNNITGGFQSGIITGNGRQVWTFGTSDRGVLFDALRWRAQYARGTTTTSRPILEYLEFSFLPGIPPVLSWEATLDLRRMYAQRSQQGMLTELLALAPAQILFEVQWRGDTRLHQCKLVQIEGAAPAQPQEQGVYKVVLLEVRP